MDTNNSAIKALKVKEQYEDHLTEYVKVLISRGNKEKLKEFSELRGYKLETIVDSDIFYIGEMAEMLVPAYLEYVRNFGVISETNLKPIFHDRYVIPIKNRQGKIINLVGYSKDANERYVYGTAKYYERRGTLWGLEKLDLAYKMGYAIITEGITDALRLRDMGYPNTFAMCGTHSSDFIMQQLNRCRHGVIRIPDRDDAGLRAVKKWECNRHLTLKIAMHYKDVDEMCSESQENIDWFNDYMNDCINWILSAEHKGRKSVCEEVTIM